MCGWKQDLLHSSASLQLALPQRRDVGPWSSVCSCFGGHVPSCFQRLSKLTCLRLQIILPSQLLSSELSQYLGNPEVQHTQPLACGSSHLRLRMWWHSSRHLLFQPRSWLKSMDLLLGLWAATCMTTQMMRVWVRPPALPSVVPPAHMVEMSQQ